MWRLLAREWRCMESFPAMQRHGGFEKGGGLEHIDGATG